MNFMICKLYTNKTSISSQPFGYDKVVKLFKNQWDEWLDGWIPGKITDLWWNKYDKVLMEEFRKFRKNLEVFTVKLF